MVVLLALLNDIPIMMIAYDNAPVTLGPVRWDMMRVLSIASALGIYGVFESFVLYWLQLFGNLIVVYGVAMAPIGWWLALFVWADTLVSFFVANIVKIAAYRLIGHLVPSHVRHLTRVEGDVAA